jgi:hypothetical protein
MAGPYGGFDFEKTILAAKAGAEDRNIKIATQAVRNQQFNKEMTLRKSQLNERIRSNQAMEDYRDRTLMQADEHFDASLGQRQHEFKEKHDLDERTHEYFMEINNRRQSLAEDTLGQRKYEFGKTHDLNVSKFGLDEDKFEEGKKQFGKKFELEVDRFTEMKKQFEVTTGYKYDVLAQDWNKFEDKLKEDSRQFDNRLDENQRQFNKTFKQRRKEFRKKYKLSEKQFKEVRRMNKFKRNMSKAEFDEAVRRFDETSEYKYDVLSQDMTKFDESLSAELYKYNRSQTDREHQYDRSQGFNEYTFGRTQDFKESMYEDQIARSTLDPNLMPSTGAPQDYGTDVGFLEGLARIGGGAGTGAALGVGTGIAAAGPLGGIISPITAGGGAIVGGGIAALDLMFGSETADKGALTQAENYINEVESMVPMIADRPLNQAAISQQLTQMDQSLADAKQSAKVKKLRAKIASLENKVIIPGVYNTKSMLSK